jgi:hypothetical protein
MLLMIVKMIILLRKKELAGNDMLYDWAKRFFNLKENN